MWFVCVSFVAAPDERITGSSAYSEYFQRFDQPGTDPVSLL
jgi:hypothetical protein